MVFYKSTDCTIEGTDQFVVFLPQRDIRREDGITDFYRGVQILDLTRIDGVDIDAFNSYQEIGSDSPWALLSDVPDTEGRGIAMNLGIDGNFKPGPSAPVIRPDAGSVSVLATSLTNGDADPAIGRLRTMLLDIVKEQFAETSLNQQMERMRSTIPIYRDPVQDIQPQNVQDPNQNLFMNFGMFNSINSLRPAPIYPMQSQPQYPSLPQLLPRPQSQSQVRPQFQQLQPQSQPVQQNLGIAQQMNMGMFNSNPSTRFGSELLDPQTQGRATSRIGTRLNALDQIRQQNIQPSERSTERLYFPPVSTGSGIELSRPITYQGQHIANSPFDNSPFPQFDQLISNAGNQQQQQQNTQRRPGPFTIERVNRPLNTEQQRFSGTSPTQNQLRELGPQPQLRNPLSSRVQPNIQAGSQYGVTDEDITLRALQGFQDVPGSPTLRGNRGDDYGGPPRILGGLANVLDQYLASPPMEMPQQPAYRRILGYRDPSQLMGPPQRQSNRVSETSLFEDVALEEEDERRRFPSLVDTEPTMEIETETPPELELDLLDFSDLTPVNADFRRRVMDGWMRGQPILGNLMTLPINYLDENWAIIDPTYESLLRDIEEIWVPYYQSRWAAQEGGYREAYNSLTTSYAELERRREQLVVELRAAAREANRWDPDSTNGMIADWQLKQLRLERDDIRNRQELLTWKMEDNDRLRARKRQLLQDEYAARVRELDSRYRIWRGMAEINIEMQETMPVRSLREPTFGRIPDPRK
ncbi:hypothetical protein ABW21_db0200457 [Orbilia brochopaga]|nr:hypothetical protein ABW21_db0200457 [Drechslerella brochopaga]